MNKTYNYQLLFLFFLFYFLVSCSDATFTDNNENAFSRDLLSYQQTPINLSGLELFNLTLPKGLTINDLDPGNNDFSGSSEFAFHHGRGNQPNIIYFPRGNDLFETGDNSLDDIPDLLIWNGNDNFRGSANIAIDVSENEFDNADGLYIGRTVPATYLYIPEDSPAYLVNTHLLQIIKYIPPQLLETLSTKTGVTNEPRVYPARLMGASFDNNGDFIYAYNVGNEVHLNKILGTEIDATAGSITASTPLFPSTIDRLYTFFSTSDIISPLDDANSKIISINSGNTPPQNPLGEGEEYEIMSSVRDTDSFFSCSGTSHLTTSEASSLVAISFNRGYQIFEDGGNTISGQPFGRYSIYNTNPTNFATASEDITEVINLRTNRSCEERILYTEQNSQPILNLLSSSEIGLLRLARIFEGNRDNFYYLRDSSVRDNYMQLVSFTQDFNFTNEFPFLVNYLSAEKLNTFNRNESSIAFFKIQEDGSLFPDDEPLSQVNFVFGGDIVGGSGTPQAIRYLNGINDALLIWIRNTLSVVDNDNGRLLAGPTEFTRYYSGPKEQSQMFYFPDILEGSTIISVSGFLNFDASDSETAQLELYRFPNTSTY